jgi:PKD repeat protein
MVVKNDGYSLDSVEWDFGGKEKKAGALVDYEIISEGRLEVTAKYVFKHSGTDETGEVTEKIVFESRKKDLAAQMSIVQDSSYAPSTIRFDASASSTKNGTITKFIFDFGAGKPAAEGDAVQTYRYDAPGEYTVTLTVVKDDGTKDSVSRKIVIKDLPKSLTINTSVSSGFVGKGIDFDAFGSVGQIDSYSWDFGDSTALSSETTPTHAYGSSGTYTVKLQVRYADGTLRNAEKEITVR